MDNNKSGGVAAAAAAGFPSWRSVSSPEPLSPSSGGSWHRSKGPLTRRRSRQSCWTLRPSGRRISCPDLDGGVGGRVMEAVARLGAPSLPAGRQALITPSVISHYMQMTHPNSGRWNIKSIHYCHSETKTQPGGVEALLKIERQHLGGGAAALRSRKDVPERRLDPQD